MARRRFMVLWRAFFSQFFSSESVTSDHQMRQAMIGVLAFLVTPGFLIPFQLSGAFEFAAIRFPVLLEPLTRLMMTIFITYSIVAIGLIAAFSWDALTFDRRDAMVFGPLPLGSATVIGAKLAAMAAFLLIAAGGINILTAVPFAAVASGHQAVTSVSRQLFAHLAATVSGATFVFCAFVTLRTVLGLLGRGGVATASLLQFLLVTAMLCFIALVPTAVKVVPAARVGRRVVAFAVQQQTIPAWSPTNWFLGLYDLVRGTTASDAHVAASRAAIWTLVAIVAAILSTLAGYRRQLQLALTPASSTVTVGFSRLQRALARPLVGRNRVAAATADFVLTTIARNRSQQAPIAINAALGVVIVMISAWRTPGGILSLLHDRALAFSVPLVLAYWATIGARAAFFVPSELPAAWSFRANAPTRTTAYAAGTRAALIAFIAPPAALVAIGLTASTFGLAIALRHAAFVTLWVAALAEIVVLTIDFVPFTQPYQPGHAKLRTRWPLYLIGLYAFGYGTVHLERFVVDDPRACLITLAAIALAIVTAGAAARRVARRWIASPSEDAAGRDGGEIAVLNIGLAFTRDTEWPGGA